MVNFQTKLTRCDAGSRTSRCGKRIAQPQRKADADAMIDEDAVVKPNCSISVGIV